MSDLREELANYAHATWAGWMRYMFDKSVRLETGAVLIPPQLVERWTRQMETPYGEIPFDEQKSDRDEADRILTIIRASSV